MYHCIHSIETADYKMSYQNLRELTGDKEGMRNGEKKRKRRVRCHKCHEPCTGEVLRVQDRHFHINCFYCSVCNHRLHSGGFYVRGEDYYCTADYQNMYGTKCFVCHKYVEGEVVTALNNTYHKECFRCDTCKDTFSPGTTVTYDGHFYLCQNCLDLNRSRPGYNHAASDIDTLPPTISQNNFETRNSHFVTPYEGPSRKQDEKRVKCYKCHQYINHSTLVVAMGKLWHQWCFTCLVCQRMMTGKFVARGDDIYCENHYFDTFGTRCLTCHKYITGKVLMADKACYHYECAVCAYCNQSFNNDQDLYKESDGDRLWHQDCGLESRQKLFSTDESSYTSPMSPEYSETSSFQRDITTPTPQHEEVTLSFTTEKQSPPKLNHVRDNSFLNSEMRSRHSSLYSKSTQLSSTSPYPSDKASELYTTTSESQLGNSLERKNRNNSSSATSILNNSTNNYSRPRQRTASDTYSIYIAAGNSKIIKKTKEPLNDIQPVSDKENSPGIHHRQSSDISITSIATEKQHSPSPKSKRNTMLKASDTSTILRTLKKTQEYFDTSVTEPVEHKLPSPVHEEKPNYLSPFNSSSSRSSISSPHLEHSTSDTSSPLSDPIPRKNHQHSVHNYNSSKARRNLRAMSAVYNTDSSIYNPVVYPLERLLVTAGEYQVFPKDVDRYRLEQHLCVEDFDKSFGMSKGEFYNLPPWKQNDLKKKSKLF